MDKQLVVKISSVIVVVLMFGLLFLVLHQEKQITEVGVIPKASVFYQKKLSKDVTKKTRNLSPQEISNKMIYLTFDDGPSFLTRQILDILEEKNVPATFFVIGSRLNEYEDIVKREYFDGHTVALHSNTHNYQYIYTSLDNYTNDLMSIRNRVYNITGQYARIVRLPGGASNTVSKRYKKGVMTEVTNWLSRHDYYYFDWNVDSLDASGNVSKEIIYNSVIKNLKNGNNIVLMHDSSTKQTTVDALPYIIDYGKNNGYTFARITKNTLPYHHKVKN